MVNAGLKGGGVRLVDAVAQPPGAQADQHNGEEQEDPGLNGLESPKAICRLIDNDRLQRTRVVRLDDLERSSKTAKTGPARQFSVPGVLDSRHAWASIFVMGGYGLVLTNDGGLHWALASVPQPA